MSATPSTALQSNEIASGEIDFSRVAAIAMARKWFLLKCAGAALVAAALFCALYTPRYESDALVQVEPKENSLSSTLGTLGTMMAQEQPVTAEMAILQSRLVLVEVVKNLHLDLVVRPHYFPVIGHALARLYEHESPTQDPSPSRLGMSGYSWGNDSIVVTDFVVPQHNFGTRYRVVVGQDGAYELYDNHGEKLFDGHIGVRGNAQTEYGTVSIFVQDIHARPGVKFNLSKLDLGEALQGLRDHLKVEEKDAQSGVISISFTTTSDKLSRDVANAIVDQYLRQNLERRSVEAAEELQFVSDQLPQLRQQVTDAENALVAYKVRRGSADLDRETQLLLEQSVDLESRRLDLQQKKQESERLFKSGHPIVKAIDDQLDDIRGKSSTLQGKIKELPDSQQELLRLQQDVDVNNQLYTSMLDTSQQLEIAKAGTVGNVRIVDHAIMPYTFKSPLSPFVGLVLGLVLVVLMSTLQRGIADPAIIERLFGLPTYAAIPYSLEQNRIHGRNKKGVGSGILFLENPKDIAAEAVRSLRTSLQFAMVGTERKIVALTGPLPGLGKSFVSINLAAAVAISGKRVVLVDGDMRRGRVSTLVGGGKKAGLADYIAGAATLDQVSYKCGIEGLTIIPSGTYPPNPSELLQSPEFAAFLRTLEADFDLVVLDTPPCIPVTDASIMCVHATTLVVLKSGAHSLTVVDDCMRRLKQGGVEVRGVIFNQVGRGGGAYGYEYGQQYAY
jgi:tyrosine-protein kinase Etk/Wzc